MSEPSPGEIGEGSGNAVAIEPSNTLEIAPPTDDCQELSIHDGRRHLGIVRETVGGLFVAVIAGEVVGPFASSRAATDALIEIARGAP